LKAARLPCTGVYRTCATPARNPDSNRILKTRRYALVNVDELEEHFGTEDAVITVEALVERGIVATSMTVTERFSVMAQK